MRLLIIYFNNFLTHTKSVPQTVQVEDNKKVESVIDLVVQPSHTTQSYIVETQLLKRKVETIQSKT